jgi:hypothetical protein
METKPRNRWLTLIAIIIVAMIVIAATLIITPTLSTKKYYSDVAVRSSFVIDGTNYFTTSNTVNLETKAYSYHELYSFDRLDKKMTHRANCLEESDICTIKITIPIGKYFIESWGEKPVEVSVDSELPVFTNVNPTERQTFFYIVLSAIFGFVAWVVIMCIAGAVIPKKKEEEEPKKP